MGCLEKDFCGSSFFMFWPSIGPRLVPIGFGSFWIGSKSKSRLQKKIIFVLPNCLELRFAYIFWYSVILNSCRIIFWHWFMAYLSTCWQLIQKKTYSKVQLIRKLRHFVIKLYKHNHSNWHYAEVGISGLVYFDSIIPKR